MSSPNHDLWKLFYTTRDPNRIAEVLRTYPRTLVDDAFDHFVWWCNHSPNGWQRHHAMLRKVINNL